MQNPAPDLSQLKDIHLPNPISEWPMAIGWWLLLAFFILAIIAGIIFWQQDRKKNQTKKAALWLLKRQYNDFKEHKDKQVFLQQSNQVLKRYCLEKYPHAAGLSGKIWLSFLNRRSPKTFFKDDLANAISQGLYQQHCEYDAHALYSACINWLKNNKPIQQRESFWVPDTTHNGGSHD